MSRPPRPRNRSLFDAKTRRFVLLDGTSKSVIGLALLVLLPRLGSTLAATATCVFLYESTAKRLSVYPARKLGPPPLRNLWLHWSVLGAAALDASCVLWGPLRGLLGLTRLTASELLALGLAFLISCGTGELVAGMMSRRQAARLPYHPGNNPCLVDSHVRQASAREP